ncbi:MAG: type II secretion system GspH family protein [Zoogloeaceae bacterium]|jgi:prepilin-type N-terminal cleavage/methylation domain-containing protein|nr:type II secretion system GspH family protein [Zoogloeaceae bacterium]
MKYQYYFSDDHENGFSLLEMAVALTIIGIMIIAFWNFFRLSQDVDDAQVAIEQLALADEAIQGFVLREHRLPCPAETDGDGVERTKSGGCQYGAGEFPFKTLGMRFPERLRYAATPSLALAIARHKPWLPIVPPNTSDTEWPLRGDASYTIGSYEDAVNEIKNAFAGFSFLQMGQVSTDLGGVALQNMSTLGDNPKLVRKFTQAQLNAVTARVNGLDFCAALRDAQVVTPDSVLSNSIPVAYAIAHPGTLDSDDDGNFFDLGNTASGATFEAPWIPATDRYDDHVIAVGFAELAARLACPARLSTANAAGHTARAVYDNYLISLAILQYQAFKLDLAYDSHQQADLSMKWATWSMVNDSLSAVNSVFDIALTAAGSSPSKIIFSVFKTALSVLKFILTGSKMAMDILKLSEAKKKRDESDEKLAKAKKARIDAEIYAHRMLKTVDAATDRAMTIDEKGLLP